MIEVVSCSASAQSMGQLGTIACGRLSMNLVAQISNLLYRRFPIGSWGFGRHRGVLERPAGWKHCETADWKSALRWPRSGVKRGIGFGEFFPLLFPAVEE